MKPIKNKKRIDPRYFLDETAETKEEPAKLSEVTLTQAPRPRRIR